MDSKSDQIIEALDKVVYALDDLEQFLQDSIFVFAVNDLDEYYICDIDDMSDPIVDRNKVALSSLREFLVENFGEQKKLKLHSVGISFSPEIPCKRIYDFVSKYELILKKDFNIDNREIRYKISSPFTKEDERVHPLKYQAKDVRVPGELNVEIGMSKDEVSSLLQKANFFKMGELKEDDSGQDIWIVDRPGAISDRQYIGFDKEGKVEVLRKGNQIVTE